MLSRRRTGFVLERYASLNLLIPRPGPRPRPNSFTIPGVVRILANRFHPPAGRSKSSDPCTSIGIARVRRFLHIDRSPYLRRCNSETREAWSCFPARSKPRSELSMKYVYRVGSALLPFAAPGLYGKNTSSSSYQSKAHYAQTPGSGGQDPQHRKIGI